jgi:hypothetical protein
MTPEEQLFADRFDALITESRDTNTRVRFLESNHTLMVEAIIGISKWRASIEDRMSSYEQGSLSATMPPMRAPSVSVTSEVASKVSASMMPSLREAMRPNTVSNIASGVVIALAIIAYAIFGHH